MVIVLEGNESPRICQTCGKNIKFGEQAIEIRIGKMEGYAKAPCYRVRYSDEKTDFFHKSCDIAVSQ